MILDELLAHIEPAHEMRRHTDRVQLRHQIFGNAVVEDALAFDSDFLGGVGRRGVVLEILDQRTGLGTLIEDLALALVNHAPALHGVLPSRVPCGLARNANGDSTFRVPVEGRT
jgi:hypothetical protein